MTVMTIEAIRLWEPDIPSDGLTLDTPLGDVDLVAIDRARHGHPVALTEAELTWLALDLGRMTDTRDPEQIAARRLLAEALGLTPNALSWQITSRLTREGR